MTATVPGPVQAFQEAQPHESLAHLPVPTQRSLLRHLSDGNFVRYGRVDEPPVTTADHVVAAPSGPVRIRTYRPDRPGPLPAHVFLHGGGWWLGSVDELVNEAICHHRSRRSGCLVVAVDYRLAPEHPFPTAIDDAHAVLSHLVDNPAAYGVDAGAISVGGVSAGANLAAALVQRCRDEGAPAIVMQLLEVPVLDLTRWTGADADDPDPHHAGELVAAVHRYLGPSAPATDPQASPLLREHLSGLPLTHLLAAELDPLRGDAERYAQRLAAAGVPVTLDVWPGAIHAVSFLTRVWPPAQAWLDAAADRVKAAHATQGGR